MIKAKELVKFVKSKVGNVNYVYGAKQSKSSPKGEPLGSNTYKVLKKMYPDYVWDSDVKKVGTVCVDCSGLIGWCLGLQLNSQGYYNIAKKVHPIKTIKDAPVGVAVWRKGHIGVYIGLSRYGNPYCVEARGSQYGVVKSRIDKRDFTHWFELPTVDYK